LFHDFFASHPFNNQTLPASIKQRGKKEALTSFYLIFSATAKGIERRKERS